MRCTGEFSTTLTGSLQTNTRSQPRPTRGRRAAVAQVAPALSAAECPRRVGHVVVIELEGDVAALQALHDLVVPLSDQRPRPNAAVIVRRAVVPGQHRVGRPGAGVPLLVRARVEPVQQRRECRAVELGVVVPLGVQLRAARAVVELDVGREVVLHLLARRFDRAVERADGQRRSGAEAAALGNHAINGVLQRAVLGVGVPTFAAVLGGGRRRGAGQCLLRLLDQKVEALARVVEVGRRDGVARGGGRPRGAARPELRRRPARAHGFQREPEQPGDLRDGIGRVVAAVHPHRAHLVAVLRRGALEALRVHAAADAVARLQHREVELAPRPDAVDRLALVALLGALLLARRIRAIGQGAGPQVLQRARGAEPGEAGAHDHDVRGARLALRRVRLVAAQPLRVRDAAHRPVRPRAARRQRRHAAHGQQTAPPLGAAVAVGAPPPGRAAADHRAQPRCAISGTFQRT